MSESYGIRPKVSIVNNTEWITFSSMRYRVHKEPKTPVGRSWKLFTDP